MLLLFPKGFWHAKCTKKRKKRKGKTATQKPARRKREKQKKNCFTLSHKAEGKSKGGLLP
jgi:hypothetical protein